MDKGILIIALGDKYYGKLAGSLSLSIKKNNKIPIALLHTKECVQELPDRIKDQFDVWIPIKESDLEVNGSIQYQYAKMFMYDITPFQQTIYLDADTLICPGRRVGQWFTELAGKGLTMFNNSSIDFKNEVPVPDDERFWGDINKIKEYYGLEQKTLPQTNATFIYFEKHDTVQAYFQAAKTIYQDPEAPCREWNKGKPDDFCWSVAYAALSLLPHQIPYRPVYFPVFCQEQSREFIIDNYIAISNGTSTVPKYLVDIYDSFIDYYFDYFGLVERYYHQDKREVISSRRWW